MRVNPQQSSAVSSTKPEVKTDKAASANRAEKLRQMGEMEKNAKSSATNDSAKTDISSKAKEFSRAHAAASAAPDIREDKIAELKKRIAEGSYKVDAEAVADKMISEHMAF